MSHAGRTATDFMSTENQIQPQTQPEPQAPALRSGDLFGWAYASAEDAEQWHGPVKTREEAIAAALDYYGDEDEPELAVWISPCRPVNETDEDAEEEWTFMLTGKLERVTAADLSAPNVQAEPRRL